jgi:hypothetical protein
MLKVAMANRSEIDRLLKLLSETYDKFIGENPNYAPIDAFMAVHNFHKIVILRQTEDDAEEVRNLVCQTAADTFDLAMQKQNLYTRDHQ